LVRLPQAGGDDNFRSEQWMVAGAGIHLSQHGERGRGSEVEVVQRIARAEAGWKETEVGRRRARKTVE
jgi:hypothetical protein